MPLTLSEAHTQLRTLLFDHAGTIWSDEEIDDWLELGQQHTAATTLALQRHATFTHADLTPALRPRVREYDAATGVGLGGFGLTDYYSAIHVRLGGETLPLWQPHMDDHGDPHTNRDGTPRYWYRFDQAIGFVPVPSAAFLASYQLEIIYAIAPVLWESGASEAQAPFDQLAILFAQVMAYCSRHHWADAQGAYGRWVQLSDEYRVFALSRHPTYKSDVIQPVGFDRIDYPVMPRSDNGTSRRQSSRPRRVRR